MGKLKDLTGMKFGELTVGYDSGERRDGGVIWICKCDCGNTTNVRAGHLISGNTVSCGHLRGEHNVEKWTTHGSSNTPEYCVWESMIKRCTNPNHKSYHNYGDRGITVCDRWLHSFENFYLDMGPRPSDLHEIDRINNNGNYEPSNCRWVTKEEQMNNTRHNVIVSYKDKQYTIAQLAKECGIEYETLRRRLSRGWSVERSVETTSSQHTSSLSI